MKSQNEEQTIIVNGKTITLNADTLSAIADMQGKEGLFTSIVDVMKNSSSTTIARSTGEKSKHNYTVKLVLTNLIQGNRRMGGQLWLQTKDRATDDEELATLSAQFPHATVKKTDRV